MIYWFTGQPGHGKTVQATLLLNYINEGVPFFRRAVHLDGDHLRQLMSNQDYSKDGRVRNIETAQAIAKYVHNECYFDVIVSLVAPYRELRERLKEEIGDEIIEIYVHTDEVRGREHFHTDYEKPLENFIDLCTTGEEPEKTHQRLVEILSKYNI